MIQTNRLRLIPATPASLTAELEGREAFEQHLRIPVPPEWPPELYDRAATEYTLARFTEDPATQGWWLHYIVLDQAGGSTVVGSGGYSGLPTDEGTVELGYSVLPGFRRRGIATEATRGLISNAFRYKAVTRIIAQTLPELLPSIGVLERCGFTFCGAGDEEGVIRYELSRAAFEQGSSAQV